jgi:hypothetical protein
VAPLLEVGRTGRLCRPISLPIPEKATVILTCYQESRARNLAPLARAALKCDFVEKVVVSNHNPRLRIAEWVTFRDVRLVLVDQEVRRGCEHRWELAREQGADYYVAIDDDVLIYPKQLSRLFRHLVERPEIPHGLAGGSLPHTYFRRKEMEVELLFEIYACTSAHIRSYFEYLQEIKKKRYASDQSIMNGSDYILLSKSGKGPPRIHDVGFLLRCVTAYQEGVATFKESDFLKRSYTILKALDRIDRERDGYFQIPL